MRVLVYGFGFEPAKTPKLISPSDIFKSLEAKTDLTQETKLRVAVTTVPVQSPDRSSASDWWLGVLLKVRDTRRFTKLTQKGDKQLMTSELLTGNDALAEANAFLVHPETGSGLYAHYHQSASMNGDLAFLLRKEFQAVKQHAIHRIATDASLSEKEKKKRLKTVRAYMPFRGIMLQAGFANLVANMRRVESVRVRLATVASVKGLFTGHRWKPQSEVIEYTIPKNAVPGDIADDLGAFIANGDAERVSVTGFDQHGSHRSFSKNQNAEIIEELDYDTDMDGFELDFAEVPKSLRLAKISRKLIQIARRENVWQLLSKT